MKNKMAIYKAVAYGVGRLREAVARREFIVLAWSCFEQPGFDWLQPISVQSAW